MKKSLLLTAAFAGVCFAGSAFAGTNSECCNKAVAADLHVVPVKVVAPTDLPRAFADTTVKVEFSLDASGQPRDIEVRGAPERVLPLQDRALKRQLVRAFREWKFDGDVQQASESGRRFVLPLKLVGEV